MYIYVIILFQTYNVSSDIGTLSTPILCGACGAYDVTTHVHLNDVIWGFPVSIFGSYLGISHLVF